MPDVSHKCPRQVSSFIHSRSYVCSMPFWTSRNKFHFCSFSFAFVLSLYSCSFIYSLSALSHTFFIRGRQVWSANIFRAHILSTTTNSTENVLIKTNLMESSTIFQLNCECWTYISAPSRHYRAPLIASWIEEISRKHLRLGNFHDSSWTKVFSFHSFIVFYFYASLFRWAVMLIWWLENWKLM